MENNDNTEVVIFGGGCFWCTEAVFQKLRGVESVTAGYSGGGKESASYFDVASGKTEHAEAVKVVYNPAKITFLDLLTVFFATHDPTSLNKQGADVGEQYRSAIFYTTEEQKKASDKFVEEINTSSGSGTRVVTEVRPLENFYEAEKEHQNYYQNNSSQSYCQIVINPKLEKVNRDFKELLRKDFNHETE